MEDLEMATEGDGRILEMIYLSYDEAEPTEAPYIESPTHQEDISPSSARVSDSRLIKEDTSVQPNAQWNVAGDSQRYDNFYILENGLKSEENT